MMKRLHIQQVEFESFLNLKKMCLIACSKIKEMEST